MKIPVKPVKEEVKRLLEGLHNDATWDDVMDAMYVRQKVRQALRAAEEGRTIPHETVKRRFLSP